MKCLISTSAIAAACLFSPAHAAFTETFEGATASNAAYGPGVIPGTGVEVTSGYAWIAPATDHGNVLDLASGWYAPNYDPVANVGSSSAQSVLSFDLIAGYTYTLSFDYSRQAFSAGNGPFDTSLTASLGSQSVTYNEVVGFYYGFDWKNGGITWTQQSDELGVHVVFVASGPAGYSGMVVDNVSMIGLPPSPVPEPASYAMMLAGLGVAGLLARRRGGRAAA